jgi:hypothetical protein
MIASEVLADALEAVASPTGDKVLEDTVDDEPLVLAVKRIA